MVERFLPCSLATSLKTPTGCFFNARPYHPGYSCHAGLAGPAVLRSCSPAGLALSAIALAKAGQSSGPAVRNGNTNLE